jgi:hypothetical protein
VRRDPLTYLHTHRAYFFIADPGTGHFWDTASGFDPETSARVDHYILQRLDVFSRADL